MSVLLKLNVPDFRTLQISRLPTTALTADVGDKSRPRHA